MAYFDSSSPLPRNSLDPPSQCEADSYRAAVARANQIAANGRVDTFNAIPPLSSFPSPTVAGDAARILNQSRTARASILTGSVPDAGLPSAGNSDVSLPTPEVVPLNGMQFGCSRVARPPAPPATQRVTMPLPPPQPVQLAWGGRPGPVVFMRPADTPVSNLDVGGVLQGGASMSSGPMGYMGMSGYAPPWGDTGTVADVTDSGEGFPWGKAFLALGGLVILGTVVAGENTRRRRKKR